MGFEPMYPLSHGRLLLRQLPYLTRPPHHECNDVTSWRPKMDYPSVFPTASNSPILSVSLYPILPFLDSSGLLVRYPSNSRISTTAFILRPSRMNFSGRLKKSCFIHS